MEWRELMVDGYDRLPDLMKEVLAGLRMADLDRQPHRDCNSLGWTAWHLTRVQDSQIAELMVEARSGSKTVGVRNSSGPRTPTTRDTDTQWRR